VERTLTPGRRFAKSTVLHGLAWPSTAAATESSEVMAISDTRMAPSPRGKPGTL